jgi:threonine dehydrogenase-like Zn-dependent dehydrogenase
MLAAIYNRKKNIEIRNIPKPEIGDNEVLLKVKVCSICGTDRKIYEYGHFKIKEKNEQILGHEISGVIEEVGKKVDYYEKGMRIALAPNVGCGFCEVCRKGLEQLCLDYNAFGISWPGGFTEYVKIPEIAVRHGNLVEIPESLSYEEAAIIEPLSCCYNAHESLNVRPGESLLIFGAGPMGILHLILNKYLGIGMTIVTDVDEKRLKLSQGFGADYIVKSDSRIKKTVISLTNGFGVDNIITAASVPEIQEESLGLVAINGKINFFAGLPVGKEEIKLNSNIIHYKQLKITGTTGASLKQFRQTVRLSENIGVNFKKVISKRIGLEELSTIFKDVSVFGNNLKIVINF